MATLGKTTPSTLALPKTTRTIHPQHLQETQFAQSRFTFHVQWRNRASSSKVGLSEISHWAVLPRRQKTMATSFSNVSEAAREFLAKKQQQKRRKLLVLLLPSLETECLLIFPECQSFSAVFQWRKRAKKGQWNCYQKVWG